MIIETKLTFSGNKYVFSVPKALIDCQILEKGKSYKLVVEDTDKTGRFVLPTARYEDHRSPAHSQG